MAAALVACGGREAWQVLSRRPEGASGAPLSVRLVTQPSLEFRPEQGATWMRLQYVVRRADQAPLDHNDFDARLSLAGRPLDPEASAHAWGEPVVGAVTYSLVLDATYSLVAAGDAPFLAMREAARASVVAGGARLAAAGPHPFRWALTWFDDHVYTPRGDWDVDDILRLPPPTHGSFTRLRSAIAHRLAAARRADGAPSHLWHHVMVVFTDGADNHSHVELPAREELLDLPGPGQRRSFAAETGPARGEAQLLEEVRAASNLTLHTIGIGPADPVQHAQLAALAEAGRGTYQHDADAGSLAALFDRVAYEFASVQTQEVMLPVAAGDYDFAVQVRAAADGAEGRVGLRVHLGDGDAAVLAAPSTSPGS